MKTLTIIEKFYEDVSRLGLRFPVAAISEATGFNKSYVSKVLSRKLEPSNAFLKKFYEAFPEGGKNVSHEMRDDDVPYHRKRLEIKNGDKHGVPVYGGFTTLGNITVYDDEGMKEKVVAELPWQIFPGCDHAEKATGDSMYPLIMNQAWLVGRKCTIKGIVYGEKYIIRTNEGLDTTKFVHPGSTPEFIKLKAYNKNIPDQEVSLSDITFACRVQWIINPT